MVAISATATMQRPAQPGQHKPTNEQQVQVYHSQLLVINDPTMLGALLLVYKKLRDFEQYRCSGKITVLVRDGRAITVQREDAEQIGL